MPQFLQLYQSDPFRNPAQDGCITCHMSPQGGDARNVFGQAFESAGEQITPMLRAQFPDRFIVPVSRQATGLVIHFSDPGNKQIVIESGGRMTLVDVERKTVDGTPATTPGAAPPASGTAPASVTAQTSERSNIPVDEYAREGAFFGSNVVNLPVGKPLKAGGVDFLVQHRFSQDIKSAGLGGLFGFDSAATVAYGGRVGITDRIAVGVTRSNYFKTIEFNSSFQFARQRGKVPLTIQFRGGIQGRSNFHTLKRPFIQGVFTRTFADRVSLLAAPTFAFNTRNENTFLPPELVYGREFDKTQSLGLGVGIRFWRSASIVGEVIPRLHGFRGERKDYAGLSVGLQKSTFRHTFELVVSRQDVETTADYAFQGRDTFIIGFNIYRRIR
jgi:hypothetical protein